VNGMYMRALRMYHADRLAAAGLSELAPQAERVMARLGEAVSVLRDPKRRAEYVATRAGKKSEAAVAVSMVDADKSFQKGEVFLRKGDYTQAIECFSEAIKANPSENQYRAYLAWTRFDDPRARKEVLAREVLGTLQQVVASEPRFARGFYWIGQIWKYLNDPNQAEKALREALKLDRAMLEAEREIRLLEMRKAARAHTTKAPQTATARQSSGLLGKLLKRTE
jgi:tetratricopeptide (TPR) repeat protein